MASRRVFQRAARRRMSWEGSSIALTNTTGSVSETTVVTEANLENVPNPTIVRIRGKLLLRVTGVGGAPMGVIITMGIKLVSEQAASAGAGSIEHPQSDIGSDWIWWHVEAFRSINTTEHASATGMPFGASVRDVVVDSKAMRKVKPNQVLKLVIQNTVIASTATLTLDGSIRVLVKT